MKHLRVSALSPSKAAPAAAFSSSVRSKAGGLGSNAKSVAIAAARRDARLQRFAHKAASARILRAVDPKLGKRISDCCYVNHGDVSLDRVTAPDGSVRGAFSGVVTCSNVWSCPVCTARISEVRRNEMNTLLSWARLNGHKTVMVTLTARHSFSTPLAPFLDALKGAFRSLRQSRAVKSLAQVGSVTASEVTHGSNGWHPHLHVLFVLDASTADPLAAVEALRSGWLRQLERRGLSGNEHAFQVQDAQAAGQYIAKFGAAEELTLGHKKKGRGASSRSPWQILADAESGCKRSAALWREYALAFKGKRQLVWSRGLKALCGLNDLSDDQCEPEGERVTLRRWPSGGDRRYWRAARRRVCALLDAAETCGCLDGAEFGPPDCIRWRRDSDASAVIE